eukprot:SM000112S24005  [mRNA]  locus=s112:357300:369907:+ [translate_table: standard]
MAPRVAKGRGHHRGRSERRKKEERRTILPLPPLPPLPLLFALRSPHPPLRASRGVRLLRHRGCESGSLAVAQLAVALSWCQGLCLLRHFCGQSMQMPFGCWLIVASSSHGGTVDPPTLRASVCVALPATLEINVNLPGHKQVSLKGISTDRILDVKRLLAVHVEACHLTHYSLAHEVKGRQLADTVEVTALKPCVLDVVEEDYTEEAAIAHVRRLLDICATTIAFGQSSKQREEEEAKEGESSRHGDREQSTYSGSSNAAAEDVSGALVEKGNLLPEKQVAGAVLEGPVRGKNEAAAAMAAAAAATEKGDMTGMYPPSKLGQFYEFLSAGHLTPPIQFVRRSAKQPSPSQRAVGDLHSFDVKLCNGKLLIVTATKSGFSAGSKATVMERSLLQLLLRLSQAFARAYKELMDYFAIRNRFGNLPYGFRSNTWVVPPQASAQPASFPPLPMENPSWGGNGGGQGCEGAAPARLWVRDFQILSRMACKTQEERLVRDRKSFLLHSLFVDTAIQRATRAIDAAADEGGDLSLRQDNLEINIALSSSDAACRDRNKLDIGLDEELSRESIAEKNLLKGITADESTAIHDLSSLGTVLVHHRGYCARVQALGDTDANDHDATAQSTPASIEIGVDGVSACDEQLVSTVDCDQLPADIDIESQPDGGANALNANSLRRLLHSAPVLQQSMGSSNTKQEHEDEVAGAHVLSVVEESLQNLCDEVKVDDAYMRWELGACWLQSLQPSTVKDGQADCEDSIGAAAHDQMDQGAEQAGEQDIDCSKGQLELIEKLRAADYKRLEQSKTGLHLKSMRELVDGAVSYYNETAVSKLAELSDKLSHVRCLCVHEMVARAFKQVLQASIASAQQKHLGIADVIASAFNVMLGEPSRGEKAMHKHVGLYDKLHSLVWTWVEAYTQNRFGWTMQPGTREGLRKVFLLRSLCHKIGIEVAARDFDFGTSTPFRSIDIISMFPVFKHLHDVAQGLLCWAVLAQALARLIAVCGPYHRMTAGAYSLLAVVLYHTGDFNQAMIYQQKALDINERELGLDHPDTMKSYGDLAVFYYRLQHTELALKYVHRALYLLHLTCGPAHPNTAATYINVAMMEEGLGNVHVALRYLHEALKCNQRLLGPDHIQTAASYHAIAIALSLMDAYTLSVQHEQTTLKILQAKLGPDDLRTQDAAAWLDYFDSKAAEQQEAARTGAPKPDASIASKGHLSVSDLLEFINAKEGAAKKELSEAREQPRKKARRTNSRSGKGVAPPAVQRSAWDEDIISSCSSDEDGVPDASTEPPLGLAFPLASVGSNADEQSTVAGQVRPAPLSPAEATEQSMVVVDDSDEGWQEAVPARKSGMAVAGRLAMSSSRWQQQRPQPGRLVAREMDRPGPRMTGKSTGLAAGDKHHVRRRSTSSSLVAHQLLQVASPPAAKANTTSSAPVSELQEPPARASATVVELQGPPAATPAVPLPAPAASTTKTTSTTGTDGKEMLALAAADKELSSVRQHPERPELKRLQASTPAPAITTPALPGQLARSTSAISYKDAARKLLNELPASVPAHECTSNGHAGLDTCGPGEQDQAWRSRSAGAAVLAGAVGSLPVEGTKEEVMGQETSAPLSGSLLPKEGPQELKQRLSAAAVPFTPLTVPPVQPPGSGEISPLKPALSSSNPHSGDLAYGAHGNQVRPKASLPKRPALPLTPLCRPGFAPPVMQVPHGSASILPGLIASPPAMGPQVSGPMRPFHAPPLPMAPIYPLYMQRPPPQLQHLQAIPPRAGPSISPTSPTLMNPNAAEFVPGAAVKQASMNPNAVEYVPGCVWAPAVEQGTDQAAKVSSGTETEKPAAALATADSGAVDGASITTADDISSGLEQAVDTLPEGDSEREMLNEKQEVVLQDKQVEAPASDLVYAVDKQPTLQPIAPALTSCASPEEGEQQPEVDPTETVSCTTDLLGAESPPSWTESDGLGMSRMEASGASEMASQRALPADSMDGVEVLRRVKSELDTTHSDERPSTSTAASDNAHGESPYNSDNSSGHKQDCSSACSVSSEDQEKSLDEDGFTMVTKRHRNLRQKSGSHLSQPEVLRGQSKSSPGRRAAQLPRASSFDSVSNADGHNAGRLQLQGMPKAPASSPPARRSAPLQNHLTPDNHATPNTHIAPVQTTVQVR